MIFPVVGNNWKKNNNYNGKMKKKKNLVQKIWSGLLPICIARKILYYNLVRSGFSCIAIQWDGWAESVLQYTGLYCRLGGLTG